MIAEEYIMKKILIYIKKQSELISSSSSVPNPVSFCLYRNFENHWLSSPYYDILPKEKMFTG
jgi:hypothetical protein